MSTSYVSKVFKEEYGTGVVEYINWFRIEHAKKVMKFLPVLADAMADVQLLEYLEALTDREYVMGLLEEKGHINIRFDEYPKGTDYFLDLWERAAAEVEARL